MSARQDQVSFDGFQTEKSGLIRLPESFFRSLLPILDDINQLRLLLYLFWHQEQQESKIRYFRLRDLETDPALIQMVGDESALQNALSALVAYKAVLRAELTWMNETYYFINSPQGREATAAIEQGEWQDVGSAGKPIHLSEEAPNIFKLYEENIGVITPMMAEILKEDETIYPALWIKEAVEIAVTHNARNWKYIRAILDRWQKEGRGDEQNRRNDTQDPDSYRKSWLGKN